MAEQAPHDLKVVGLNPAFGSYNIVSQSVTIIDVYVLDGLKRGNLLWIAHIKKDQLGRGPTDKALKLKSGYKPQAVPALKQLCRTAPSQSGTSPCLRSSQRKQFQRKAEN